MHPRGLSFSVALALCGLLVGCAASSDGDLLRRRPPGSEPDAGGVEPDPSAEHDDYVPPAEPTVTTNGGAGLQEVPLDTAYELVRLMTVGEAVNASCSTTIVAGLSDQLIAELECLRPGTMGSIAGATNVRRGPAASPSLQTPAAAALVRASARRSTPLVVNSGLRTLAQQYLLYRWAGVRCGVRVAAAPGRSNHNGGLAVDVDDSAGWRRSLEAEGFRWLGSSDPVHFDYVGAGLVDIRALSVRAFQGLWNRNHPDDTIAVDGAYGPATESRLRQSPATGFESGASCGVPALPPPPMPAPAPTPGPTPAPAPGGASCTHSFGGVYMSGGCSASYQCCDGTWQTRGGCGECTCVEASGGTGCDAALPVAPVAVTAAALLASTATCTPVAGAPRYALDSGDASTVQLCQRGGAFWFRADLDVDCDGGRASSCTADPDYLADTAFNTSTGVPVDANTIPFAVLPLARAGFDYRTFDIRGGQSVAVIYGDRVVYGVLGDIGPSAIIGEASYAMAAALGLSPDPRSGGIDLAEVTYVFFTGTANRVAPLESLPEAARVGEAAARAFVAASP